MRIGYITPYYPPDNKGGAEISLKLVADFLVDLGHQVYIFTPNYLKKTIIEGENPKIYRLKFGADSVFSKTNPISENNFAKSIEETGINFDIIDAYLWYNPAKIVAKKLKIPYICSIRDATPICDFRTDQNPRHYPFFKYFSKRLSTYGVSLRQIANAFYGYYLTSKNLKVISEASYTTFASQALSNLFKNYNNCRQVINSVGVSKFSKAKIDIPGINFDKDKVILYAGRLSYGKGVFFLYKAAEKVLEKNKNIKFVFIGDGELKEKINNIKFKYQIFVLGKKNYDFVLSLIEKVRVTVVPSVFFEGFPRVGVESVGLGTPVIGTNLGGIPEAVGNAGIIVKPNNVQELSSAIVKICNDQKLYLELKLKTYSQAAKFKPNKIAQKVLSVYNKILV